MRSLIERFEQAVRDHEMAGAQPVEDRLLIEAEYKEAKSNLIAALRTPVSERVPSTFHIAWNEAKTVGVICEDPQMAYELRKGALNSLGIVTGDFVEAWAEMTADDNCTIQTVAIEVE